MSITENLRSFLKSKLRLEFPLDHEQINDSRFGTPGLGYVFFPGYMKVSLKTYRRMMIKLKERLVDYNAEKLSLRYLNSSWQSFKGVLDYGNNRGCKVKMLRRVAFTLH